MSSLKIIGIGNPWVGDDGVGNLVARHLKSQGLQDVDINEGEIMGLGILDLLEGATQVIIIDAVQTGQPSGTVHRWEIPPDLEFAIQVNWASGMSSTHGLGLGQALSLGDTLQKLPPQLVLYGIEIGPVKPGKGLSNLMADTVKRVAKRIQVELEKSRCTNSP